MLVLNNITRLQKRQRQQPQPQGSVLGGLKSDSINNDRRMDGNNNDNMKFVSNSGGSGTSAFLGGVCCVLRACKNLIASVWAPERTKL